MNENVKAEDNNAGELTKGVFAAVTACVMWGLSGLLYHHLSDVQATEVLAHRALWSFLFITVYCYLTNRFAATKATMQNPEALFYLLISSVFIAVNWLGFIWAVQTGHGIEASLGYYITPLINTLFGVIFLREKISKDKKLAVFLAFVGVVILTIGLGVPPWIALLVSFSFSIYSLIRKLTETRPIIGTFIENIVMVPFALLWLIGVQFFQWHDFTQAVPGAFTRDWETALLLILTGIVTCLPLILYTYATRALGLSTAGLFFYINPTIQLIVAVLAFNEMLTTAHMVALPIIWLGLAIVSIRQIIRQRAPIRTYY